MSLLRHGQRLQALKDGLRLEDHAFAATEGSVVHGAMAVMGEGAQVVGLDGGLSRAQRALQNAVVEGAAKELRKEGDDIEAHELV